MRRRTVDKPSPDAAGGGRLITTEMAPETLAGLYRNVGYLRITREVFDALTIEAAAQLFSVFFPVRTEFRVDTNSLIFVGMSTHFQPVEPGHVPHAYTPNFEQRTTEAGDVVTNFIGFTEVGNLRLAAV